MDLDIRAREAAEALRAPVDVEAGLRDLHRSRQRRRFAMVAVATAAVLTCSALVVAGLDDDGRRTEPVEHPKITPKPNGWVAVDTYEGDFVDDPYDGDLIYLVRTGEDPRPLEVPGSDATNDACPVWTPDGRRLMFGRLTGPSDDPASDAELVIVPVGDDGSTGTQRVIGLDGFEVLDGFDPHPCGIWAPDGRWVALAGAGEVWIVDTHTRAIRRLPDLRPSDLEWRPGTDELAIVGDVGTDRGAPTLATPITLYSVSTGGASRIGSVEAAHITWAPDGESLAYTGGERAPDAGQLGVVDADGANERLLVADMGVAIHGIGPVWSPTGDRIAYQRCGGGFACNGEKHEVVLVNVADGEETVIEPPKAGGHPWVPFTVSWSPDGTTLLYAGWQVDGGEPLPGGGETLPAGVIAVPADSPDDATVLIDSIEPVPNYYSHRWTPTQMWGPQPP